MNKDLNSYDKSVLLINDYIDNRIIDLYFTLDHDKDLLIEYLLCYFRFLDLSSDENSNFEEEPEKYFDIYSDYYNDDEIRASLNLIKQGYDRYDAANIIVNDFYNIAGLSENNIEDYVSIIFACQ